MTQKELAQKMLESDKEKAETAKQRAYEWMERLYEEMEKDFTEAAIGTCLYIAENLTSLLVAEKDCQYWDRRLQEIEKEGK